jgi:hypothetical protein
MAFSARAWLAEQLQCEPESLVLGARRDRGRGDEEGVYRQAGARVGRVVMSGSRTNLSGQERRLATAYLATGRQAFADLAPDELVVW